MSIEISDFMKVALGAVLAFGTKWIEQLLTRQKRRRAIATALLHELRVIEVSARQAALCANPIALGATVPGALFHRATESDDLFLFRPATISAILALDGLIRDTEQALTDARGTRAAALDPEGQFRAKAFFVSEEISRVKVALTREGGSLPPYTELQSVDNQNLPALGEPAFPEWAFKRDR